MLSALMVVGLTVADSPSANGPERGPLSSANLLADVDILQDALETLHPGLYRYNTKPEMLRHFQILRTEFQRERTLGEAFLAFSQFLAKVRCGHTHANAFNQPNAVVEALFEGTDRLPCCFRWIDGRMIVTRDLSPNGVLPRGSEIVSMNGVSASDLLAKLSTISRTDGGNEAKRIANLEVQGTARWETFDVFLSLFVPSVRNGFDLVVRTKDAADPVALRVPAQSASDRSKLAREHDRRVPGGTEPLWAFETLGNGAAYLKMPTWALYNSRWDWKTFLDRGLDALVERHAPALVIDLRGNEGGLDVGDWIAGRLISRPIHRDAYERFTRYGETPPRLTPFLSTWDKSFKNWGDFARPDRDGFFRMTKFDNDPKGDVVNPRGRRYEGAVFVLIGAENSSATFQFAQMVKQHRLATLVGQTTGGNQRGINGSAFFFLMLPHARIEVDVPLVGLFPSSPTRPNGAAIPFLEIPDAGIEPDVSVPRRRDDIARGLDAVMAAVTRLIEKRL